jgi:hypothetical protein
VDKDLAMESSEQEPCLVPIDLEFLGAKRKPADVCRRAEENETG